MSGRQWLVITLLAVPLMLTLGFMARAFLFNTGNDLESTVEARATTAVVQITPTRTATVVEPSKTPTAVPTATPTVMPSPTPTPPVFGYKIRDSMDLSGEFLTAMVIYRTDGRVITSTWAKAISYSGTDDGTEFDPHAGTIYSHIDGEFTATWIHSGVLQKGQLFAYQLEKSVWLTEQGGFMPMTKGIEETAKLRGAKVLFCQTDSKDVQPFQAFEPEKGCPGKQTEFVVIAAALIPREKTDAYEAAVGKVVDWLSKNMAGDGFEELHHDTGYLLQTCISRYTDQKSDGTVDYLYNRLVLGLTLR